MPHRVFISHSSADRNVAEAICHRLEARAIPCWLALRDVLPGAVWAASIQSAIQASDVLVLVYSEKANESEQVLRELERAVAAGVAILPFRIQDVEPSEAVAYFIGATHWLDAITPPIERHVDRLGDTIAALLAQSEDPAARKAGRAAARKPARAPSATARPKALAFGVAAVVLLGLVVAWALGVFAARNEPETPQSEADAGAGKGDAPGPGPPPAPPPPTTTVRDPWIEQGVVREGERGVAVHARVEVHGRPGRATEIRVTFHDAEGRGLRDLDGMFTSAAGVVSAARFFTPGSDAATLDDIEVFLPYAELHLVPGRRHDLLVRLQAAASYTGTILGESAAERFYVEVR